MKTNEKIHQAVREQLQKGSVKFTVDGITSYSKDEFGDWGDNPKIFKVNERGDAIYEDGIFSFNGMNVTKLGPTCVTLYTYDMLGKRCVGRIKYSDIKIIGKIK